MDHVGHVLLELFDRNLSGETVVLHLRITDVHAEGHGAVLFVGALDLLAVLTGTLAVDVGDDVCSVLSDEVLVGRILGLDQHQVGERRGSIKGDRDAVDGIVLEDTLDWSLPRNHAEQNQQLIISSRVLGDVLGQLVFLQPLLDLGQIESAQDGALPQLVVVGRVGIGVLPGRVDEQGMGPGPEVDRGVKILLMPESFHAVSTRGILTTNDLGPFFGIGRLDLVTGIVGHKVLDGSPVVSDVELGFTDLGKSATKTLFLACSMSRFSTGASIVDRALLRLLTDISRLAQAIVTGDGKSTSPNELVIYSGGFSHCGVQFGGCRSDGQAGRRFGWDEGADHSLSYDAGVTGGVDGLSD
jgi:hypothetical protein